MACGKHGEEKPVSSNTTSCNSQGEEKVDPIFLQHSLSLRITYIWIPACRAAGNPQMADGEDEDFSYTHHENYSSYDFYEDYPTVCDKEDVRSFARIFLPAIYALALVVGLAGNSLVVAVYVHYKKLRTMTDVHILNLAVADLLLLFTLPFWAANAVHGWELGLAMCKLTSAMYAINFSCGMLFLACISIDRYLAVLGPGRGHKLRCWQRVAVCLFVWATALVLGAPDMIFATVKQITADRKACIAVYSNGMATPTKATLEILDVVLSFLLPFLVMIFCYIQLARTLNRIPEARRGKKKQAFRVLVAVVGVFVITQLPYNIIKFCRAMDIIYTLVTHCELSKGLDRAMQVTESLALSHSCLNPVLYAFLGSSFRQHLLKLLKAFGQRRRGQRHQERQGEVEISLNSHTPSDDTSHFTI
ncbi:atypical chemokine receptor 4 [Arapaima gigas]